MGALRQHENVGHPCPKCGGPTVKNSRDTISKKKRRKCTDCHYQYVEELYPAPTLTLREELIARRKV